MSLPEMTDDERAEWEQQLAWPVPELILDLGYRIAQRQAAEGPSLWVVASGELEGTSIAVAWTKEPTELARSMHDFTRYVRAPDAEPS